MKKDLWSEEPSWTKHWVWMVVYPLFPASSGEAWWPGCLWPEQGAPAASVWEVQSPGLLLPPRAIRTGRSAPTPASFSLCPSSPLPYPRRAPRKSEMCQNVFVNIANAIMALCIKSIKHIYLIYVYNWWLNICFRRVSLPVLISKPGTMADLNLVLSLTACLQTAVIFPVKWTMWMCWVVKVLY